MPCLCARSSCRAAPGVSPRAPRLRRPPLWRAQARRRRDSAPGSGPRGQGGAAEQGRDGRALRPGDPGFRWHASIPEPARLDYVRRPTSQVAMDVNKARAKPKGDKMDKRLKMMNRPGRAGLAKAAKVSVEGRGM